MAMILSHFLGFSLAFADLLLFACVEGILYGEH